MASKLIGPALLLASLGLLSGCSAVFSSSLDKEQCTRPEDCDTELSVGELTCIENICQNIQSQCGTCDLSATCFRGQCVSKECVEDIECGDGNRCGFDKHCYSKWGCLNAAADWPSPPKTPFKFKTTLQSLDNSPIGDVVAHACTVEDVVCKNPTVPGTDVTFKDNVLEFNFNQVRAEGFTGSLTVTPKRAEGAVIEHGKPWMDIHLQVPGVSPLADAYTTPRPLAVLTPTLIELLLMNLPVTVTDKTSLTSLEIYDCGGKPAPGVKVFVVGEDDDPTTLKPPPTVKFYPVGAGNQPTVPPAGTAIATGPTGRGFLLELPGLYGSLQLVDEASGKDLGKPLQFGLVPGAFNNVTFFPRYTALQAWMRESRGLNSNPDAGM
jgi:hypothetical protein